MTHAECINHACELARRLGYKLILKEFKADTRWGEIPDIIAFKGGGDSLVIECKVSRSDFLADKEKLTRKFPAQGMGLYRMYVMPENVACKKDLPRGWHYTILREDGYPISTSLESFGNMALPSKDVHMSIQESFLERSIKDENAVLYSYIRKSGLLNEKDYPLTHKNETWIKEENQQEAEHGR